LSILKSTFLQKRVYGIEKKQEDVPGIIALKISFPALLLMDYSSKTFIFFLLFLARY